MSQYPDLHLIFSSNDLVREDTFLQIEGLLAKLATLADPSDHNPPFSQFIYLLRNASMQWSRIVAWTWLINEGEQNTLRAEFVQVLCDQAFCSSESYDVGMALEKSEEIAEYLIGRRSVGGDTIQSILNLPDDQTYAFTPAFMEIVHPVVDVETFSGGLASFNYRLNKFIAILPYPPRPGFSLTQLEELARGEISEGSPIPTGC